jgi:ABC-type antimicrobial peptide transport system permease subunit
VLYPGRDPIGLPVRVGADDCRIVGVVSDVRQMSLEEASGLQMYLPHTHVSPASSDLIIRSTLPPASLAASVRQAVSALNPTLIASEFRPVTDLVDRSVSPRRFLVSLIGGFAGLALLLASLGVYGVVSYAVSQRVREIGVRMALGATGRDVRRHVLGGTMRLTLLGVLIGLAVSLALGRVLAALLFGTSPTDPASFAGTAVVLTSVALIAGYVPALRASRIEPMTALRTE